MDPAPTGEDGESHSARPGKVIGKTTRMACDGLVLAHVNTNAIEAAYRRSDLFERRRELSGWPTSAPRASSAGSTSGGPTPTREPRSWRFRNVPRVVVEHCLVGHGRRRRHP